MAADPQPTHSASESTTVDVAHIRHHLEPHGITLIDADTVPVEVFVVVVEALNTAHVELEQLRDTPMPLPGEVVEKLREHVALLGTLRGAPEDWKAALRANYELAIDGVQVDAPGVEVTLLSGVLDGLDEVWELLRRAALTDAGVDAALRQAA